MRLFFFLILLQYFLLVNLNLHFFGLREIQAEEFLFKLPT